MLWGAKVHYVHVGQEQGKQEAAQESKELIQKQQADARGQIAKVLNDSADAINAASSRYQQAVARTEILTGQLAQLKGEREAAEKQVVSMKDEALHQFNVQQLGQRPITDTTPGYYLQEERKIADVLTQYPLCEKEVGHQADQIEEIRKQVVSLNDKINEMDRRDIALVDYTNFVERSYVNLYNAFPRKRNWLVTIATFGMKGKPRALQLPAPLDLQAKRPK